MRINASQATSAQLIVPNCSGIFPDAGKRTIPLHDALEVGFYSMQRIVQRGSVILALQRWPSGN